MIITKQIKEVRKFTKKAKKNNKLIGFVPTMGALHQGHLSLIEKGKKESDYLIVTIFINPLQFGPKEDLKRYPRNLREDKKILNKIGVDLLFCPETDKMYGSNFSTFVEENKLSKILCGKTRPNHFRGVCTVVAKLLNIVSPDLTYFGQKDYQQALIIKKMVEGLNFNTKIKIAPIVRGENKLALSSRNLYLNKQELKESRSIFRALSLAKKMIKNGEKQPSTIIAKMKKIINANSTASIDYIEIRKAEDLGEINKIKGMVFIGVAAYFGKTRLIDNIIIGSY